MATDIRDFKEYELYPAIYGDPNRAFPELHFKKDAKGWASEYHTDGTRDSKGAVTTHIYSNNQSRAIDYARGNVTLIDLYMSLHSCDFSTAYRELADLYGLTLPNYSEEEERNYREAQESREAACKTFQEALWSGSPEAEATLRYLHEERKMSDEVIRKAGLGLITTEIINSLPEDDRHIYRIRERKTVEEDGQKVEKVLGEVGKTHTLAIPYRAGSSLLGFTFRRIFERQENSQKYLNSKGLKKSWLLNIGVGAKDILIVEGYLDALHAMAKGADNVAATTQAKASDAMIQDALRRGVERFTLLYDMDKAGDKSIIPTIEAIHRYGGGKSIFVASLPDGYKDTDEYLRSHTIEQFDREVARKAVPYSHFVFMAIARKYQTQEDELGEIEWKDRDDFLREVKRLLNSDYIKPTEREDIFRMIEQVEDGLSIRVQDFREEADREKALQDALRQNNETTRAAAQIYELARSGKTEEAITLMGERASTLRTISTQGKYDHLLTLPTYEGIRERLQSKPTGIETPYYFGDGDNREQLILPSGAMTFVCAPTSHGKSRMLQNLALHIAQNGQEGAVLYFTFEEDTESVTEQMENNFIGKFISGNNLRNIKHYHKHGDFGDFVSRESIFYRRAYDFEAEERKFFELLEDGRLRLFYEDYDSTELIEAIKYLCGQIKVKAVFIDYIQLLTIKGTRLARPEMLKEICVQLKNLSVEASLPVVAAAQLNREAKSPIEMHNQNIADAADLERTANTVICLWNSAFAPNVKSEWVTPKAKEDDAGTGYTKPQFKPTTQIRIEQMGFEMGEPGRIYAKLTKNRGGAVGLDTVLDFEGNTGRITDRQAARGAAKDFAGIIDDDDLL